MSGLPVVLEVAHLPCLVVGAGAAGRRKAATLAAAGAPVTVLAPDAAPGPGVTVLARTVQPGDTAGFRLVVTATGDPAIDDAVAAEARAHGALVLRADRPEAGDLRFAATHRTGPVTVAVDTGGCSPTVAAAIRDEIAAADDGTWAALATWARANRPVSAADVAARRRELRP